MRPLIFLVIFTLPLTLLGQDWKSVRLNDTTYYTISASDNYLRVIWIDSVKEQGGDTINYFYPSIRLGNTNSNCLDTLGPTWLGKSYIKKPNGDELFFNRWLDTINLKPTSSLNSSWLMFTDTANKEFYATITALDTLTIDNQLDSIKEVTIQVFIGNVPDSTHIHHNRKMVLSKYHGLVECIEWYGFPNSWSNSGEIYPIETELHHRLSKKYYHQKLYEIDLNWKYQVGNYWQHSYRHKWGPSAPFYIPYFYYVQDSITQIHLINNDSVDVTFQRRQYTIWTRGGLPDSIVRSSTTLRNMIYSSTYINDDRLDDLRPELSQLSNISNPVSTFYYVPDIICERIMVRGISHPFGVQDPTSTGCYAQTFPLGNAYSTITDSWSGFGQTAKNTNIVNQGGIGPDPYPYQETFVYAKLKSCTYGTPINFTILATKDILSASDLKVYPNPARTIIYVSMDKKYKIKTVDLYSVLGKKVWSCSACDKIDIRDFSSGLYFIQIRTNYGVIGKKVFIE